MSQGRYSDILETLRPLRLPIELGCESEVGAALLALVSKAEEPLDETLDRAALIADLHLEGERHPLLDRVVRVSVQVGMPTTGGQDLAPRYLGLFDKLTSDLLSRDLAAGLLSEAPLIYRLAAQQGMSATQIAMVLSQVLGGTFFPYDAVAQVMAAMKVRPIIESVAASSLVEMDQNLSARRFADATLAESAVIMGDAGRRLGFPDDVEGILRLLCPPEIPSRAFIPYLQALDFVCVVADAYDHPPQFLYEFAPRGIVANEIFGRYPIGLAPGGNPILNNFKAVEAADRAWARSRPSPQSYALVSLLDGLSKMPHGPRRDFAGWIRQWLVRVVSLLDASPVRILDVNAVTEDSVSRLLHWVAAGNTESAGAVEQRAVDALASALYPQADGWRPRGLGDATTISNLSRKKLGDIEFQDAATRHVEAFEPHGGRLSLPYLEGHLRSVRRVITQRLEEWKGIADLAAWSVDVHFVAHELPSDLRLPEPVEIEGVRLTIRTETFSSFIGRAVSTVSAESLRLAVSEHVYSAMNRLQTPQALRDLVANRCGVMLVDPEQPQP